MIKIIKSTLVAAVLLSSFFMFCLPLQAAEAPPLPVQPPAPDILQRTKDMQFTSNMAKTLFLNPLRLHPGTKIYISFSNTSSYVNQELSSWVEKKLVSRGYVVTRNASAAQFILQANLLYLGSESPDFGAASALHNGYGSPLPYVNHDHHPPPRPHGLAFLIDKMTQGDRLEAVRQSIFGVVDIRITEAGEKNDWVLAGTNRIICTCRFIGYETDLPMVQNAIADRLSEQLAGNFQ
jgi:hypothetical protein